MKDNDIDLDMFDVREYLDDKGVAWSSDGKNISVGWIGTNCPFCRDSSNHLGIHLETMTVSCWKCGPKGLLKLIMAIESCSFSRAKSIIPKYTLKDFAHLVKRVRNHADKTMLPPGTSDTLLPIHEKFLISRNYDPLAIVRKYDVMGVGPTLNDWKFRLIIPVYMDNKIVTYVGRDTTGNLEVPYKNAPIEKSILQAKHCIYNIDTFKDTAIIVEGILDAWRLGDGAGGTFGTQVTTEQLLLLKRKNLKRCFVMFDGRADDDGEAIGYASKLATDLSCFIPSVEVLELDCGDPDSMSEDEVWYLRKDLGM